jgi:hypothetical protein
MSGMAGKVVGSLAVSIRMPGFGSYVAMQGRDFRMGVTIEKRENWYRDGCRCD